jgi:DNA-binding NarL/FixJ family response regulator
MTIRVFVVEDHDLFASGIRSELDERFEVVGRAATLEEAAARLEGAAADVVLLDVHLPDGNGASLIERFPDRRFLALSASDAENDVLAAIRAGARGYVTKSISPSGLADAIRRVNDGDAVFSPRLAGFVLDAFAGGNPPAIDDDLDRLTRREIEILRFIARGYSYKDIAGRLHVSPRTVETHVRSVLRKLQLTSRYELSRWAIDRRFA